jgi:hypothetical protein
VLNRRFAFVVMSLFSVGAVQAQAQAVTISSVSGYSDGVGVLNGKWTGQPIALPASQNKYLNHYVVAAPNNATLGVTSGGIYKWTIKGNNFGSVKGTVWLLDAAMNSVPGVSLTVQQWSNTQIVVLANAPHTFTANSSATLWVSRLATRPTPVYNMAWAKRAHPVMGMIQSRGYGQCTWFVAKTRMVAGAKIPSPGAYSTTGSLAGIGGVSGYIPRQWDALTYATKHVSIITSPVSSIVGADKSITYRFTVGEMNAKYDEIESSSVRQYKVSAPDKNGVRKVVSVIGSNAGSKFVATGFYR